jgi:hypothetical protein
LRAARWKATSAGFVISLEKTHGFADGNEEGFQRLAVDRNQNIFDFCQGLSF